MRKLFFILSLLVCASSVSAQSKQELQENINQLNQKIGELKANLSIKTEQLEQANKKIAELEKKLQNGSSTNGAQSSLTFRDSIADLLHNYYNCTSWEQTIPYIMEPERVRASMEKYYQEKSFKSMLLPKDVVMKGRFQVKKGKQYPIYIWDVSGLNGYRERYIVKTPEGYKIDWEATTVYNPFVSTDLCDKPNMTIELRDDFNFSNDETFVDYYVLTGLFTDHLHRFLFPKNTELGKKLYNMFKGREGKCCILKIKGSTEQNYGIRYFDVVGIVSDSYSKYKTLRAYVFRQL